MWKGLRGSAPDSPGERQRVMGFLQKGEALEDEQCSEAKESGGSIRREEKERGERQVRQGEGGQEPEARACVALRCVAE